ncbi:hypothetical protein BOW53_00400 [Solemya pervernicosa gill symbiont]|uniref:3-oxoacyl-ACP synthase n=1 Tax=Solemya pervernicosa gill symbiont TaxID=642797 RepID=A0A1T2LB61_9GAMM|nr:ketoacyl-ACP synthase III [Solemya pervernicosa gill symbiont]OOZ42335.1 hypothetical protein BOW53_00400 [Solemya pervernicosa gill symbiont]
MDAILEGVRVVGLSVAVPKQIEQVSESGYGDESLRERFSAATGIKQRRLCNRDQFGSDLAHAAADRLLSELGWDRGEIDALIYLTQTPDVALPATACILQDRLGLPSSCAAFDVNQGCAGYPYGLYIAGSFLRENGPKKVLLLVGDTAGKIKVPSRRDEIAPLFGDAISATALELSNNAEPMYFQFGTDGSGWDVIMERRPCGNPPFTRDNYIHETLDGGEVACSTPFEMRGEDVFNFSTATAPKIVKELLDFAQLEKDSIDAFIFHQANKMINNFIGKRLKLEPEKTPSTLEEFGNTSSATIPITLLHRCREPLTSGSMSLVLCGFGVGLSWASVACRLDSLVIPELVEI